MRYDESYREAVRLRDGSEVVFRTIRADDKDLLREGFARLSPESRYLRFHGVKTELTDAELRYLTELDGVHHMAIGALRAEGGPGLGIARLVELTGEPGVAEAAITVVDDAQGLGLGTMLFERLVAAATERGIAKVRCLVLGSNHPMQELLKKLGATHAHVEQGVCTIDLDLPQVETTRESALYALLRLAAQRVLTR